MCMYTERYGFIFRKLDQTTDTDFQFCFFLLKCFEIFSHEHIQLLSITA